MLFERAQVAELQDDDVAQLSVVLCEQRIASLLMVWPQRLAELRDDIGPTVLVRVDPRRRQTSVRQDQFRTAASLEKLDGDNGRPEIRVCGHPCEGQA